MENLYKNFIKIDIMSDLNLENIVGFKAVDKDGNEQNVTVDEMVDMVSTRMVMALSETSTFAAAAATGNDVYENELPTVTDAANVRVLQSSGDAAKMTMQSLASKLGGLIGNTYSSFTLAKGEETLIANGTGVYYVSNSYLDSVSTLVVIDYDNSYVLGGVNYRIKFRVQESHLYATALSGEESVRVRNIAHK